MTDISSLRGQISNNWSDDPAVAEKQGKSPGIGGLQNMIQGAMGQIGSMIQNVLGGLLGGGGIMGMLGGLLGGGGGGGIGGILQGLMGMLGGGGGGLGSLLGDLGNFAQNDNRKMG
jgi:hypothetical protein